MDRWWSHGHCNSRAVGWLCLYSLCHVLHWLQQQSLQSMHPCTVRNTCRLWQNFCTGTVVFRFVTGTHRMPHKYINPKTEQTYRGVGSQEYNDVLQQHLIPEGNRLFQQAGRRAENSQLQQDDAPAHKTKGNMQCINNTVPGGHFLEWPQTHLTCPQLRIFGAGWSNSLTGRALTTLMTCKRG